MLLGLFVATPLVSAAPALADGAAVVAFDSATYAVVEQDGTVDLTVTRTGDTAVESTLGYARVGGTATPGTDFTLAAASVTFAVGETTKPIHVTLLQDGVGEAAETVVIALSDPTVGTVLGSPATAILTITDDEQAAVSFFSSERSLMEGDGTVQLGLSRNVNSAISASVDYAVTGGTATPDVDFVLDAGTLTFQPGQTIGSIPITVLLDDIAEPAETVELALSNPSQGARLDVPSAMTLTIDDAEQAIMVFASPTQSAYESDSTVQLTVDRHGKTTIEAAVDYAVTGGTATADIDYILESGTLVFAAGQTSKTIPVSINDDVAAEDDESIQVGLSAPSVGARLGSPSTTTLTIHDDDASVVVTGWSMLQHDPQHTGRSEAVGPQTPAERCHADLAGDVIGTPVTGADGTIYVTTGGASDTAAGWHLVALNPDCSPGWTYDLPGWPGVTAPAVSPNGVIYVHTNGTGSETGQPHLLAINSNGTLNWDLQYTDGASVPATERPSSPAVAPDGTIWIGATDGVLYGIAANSAASCLVSSPTGAALTSSPAVAPDGTVYVLDAANTLIAAEPSTCERAWTLALQGAGAGSLGSSVVVGPGETVYAPANEDLVAVKDGTELWRMDLGAGKQVSTPAVGTDGTIYVESDGIVAVRPGGALKWSAGPCLGSASTAGSDDAPIVGGDGLIYVQQSGAGQQNVCALRPTGTTLWTLGREWGDSGNRIALTEDGALLDTEGGLSTTPVRLGILDEAAIIAFDSAGQSEVEHAGSVDLTVTRSGNTDVPATVDYSVTGGTATLGADFNLDPGTVSFAAGETTKTIQLTLLDDLVGEADETAVVTLSNPDADTVIGATPSTTLTITDDEQAIVAFESDSDSRVEQNSTLSLPVTRAGNTAIAASVDYAVSGSATAGADYVLDPGTVTFAPGETTANIGLTLLDDDLGEAAETIVVSFVTPGTATGTALGSPASMTVTITDDETSTVAFQSATASTVERDGTVALTVVRTGNAAIAASVEYAWTDGTATSGDDFTLVAGTVTFAPGETSRTIDVTLHDDAIGEAAETVVVTLSGPGTGTVLGSPVSTTLTITDDEQAFVAFGSAELTRVEQNGTVQLPVNRTGNTAIPASVHYSISGTATAGADFTLAAGTLAFDAGETGKDIALTLLDDNLGEADETVVVTLDTPGAGTALGSPESMTVTITDNEPATVSFLSGAALALEHNGTASLTVTRAGNTAIAASAHYAVAGGTAGDADFTLLPGTVSFAAGVSTTTIGVTLLDDDLGEPDETVVVALSDPGTGTTLGSPSSATITIVDNERPEVVFDSATASAGEADPVVQLAVTRGGNTAVSASVQYAVAGGTATPGTDFTLSSGTLDFDVGETSKVITVALNDDPVDEPGETVIVNLTGVGGTLLGAQSTTVLTIADDDDPAVLSLSAAQRTVQESVGTVTLTVTRTGNTQMQAKARCTLSGSAKGSDYTISPTDLTFAPGDNLETIKLRVVNDTAPERDETITVTLTPSAYGTVPGLPSSLTLTIRPSDQKPDALISTGLLLPYAGNNVYNTTATNQTKTLTARRSQYRTYYVRIANDGNGPNTITVKGSAATAGSTVRYYAGLTNITTAMRSKAGYLISNLKPGTYKLLTVRITVGSTAVIGSAKSATVTATWTGDGTRADVVKAIVKVVR